MDLKKFWKNSNYWERGFVVGAIFGLLAYIGCLTYLTVILSESISRSVLLDTLFIGMLILVGCGLLFGLIGFLIGIIRKAKKGFWKELHYWEKGSVAGVIFGFLAYIGCFKIFVNLFGEVYAILFGLVVLVGCSFIFGYVSFLTGIVKEGFCKELILAILIMIITLGIVLTVGIRFIYNDYYNPPLHQAQTDINPFGNEEYSERERIAEAAETPGDCEKIEHELWKSYCYSHLAIKLDEPSLCDKIIVESDTKMLFISKDVCLIETAKRSEDCEKVKTDILKLHCYEEKLAERVGSELSTLGPCDKLEEKFLKYKCITGTSEKNEDCEKVEPEFLKSLCYKDFAIKLDDSNLCSKVKEEILKDKCVAETPRNKKDCESVGSGFFKSDCYHILAKRLNDSDLCNEIITSEEKRLCIAETAETPEECEKSEWPSQCYEKLAERLNDINLCDKVEDEEEYLKYDCVLKLAKKSEDCEKVKSEYHKSECYAGLAEKLHDLSLCEKVTEEALKVFCKAFFKYSLDDILNKEIEYSGMLGEKNGKFYICGDCFWLGDPYEQKLAKYASMNSPCCCCYWLDLSHYEKPIDDSQSVNIHAIVRKTRSAPAEGNCTISYGCDRLFFQVKEIIEN